MLNLKKTHGTTPLLFYDNYLNSISAQYKSLCFFLNGKLNETHRKVTSL